MGMTRVVAVVVLAALLIVAAWCDVKEHRIPNWAVFGGTALAGVLAVVPGGIGAGSTVAGLAIAVLVMLPLYLLRLSGAGDVKLMAAIGAFLGYPSTIGAILVIFVAGGVLALVWAAATSGMSVLLQNLRSGLVLSMSRVLSGDVPRLADLPVASARMPYALAIAAGTVVYLILSGGCPAAPGT